MLFSNDGFKIFYFDFELRLIFSQNLVTTVEHAFYLHVISRKEMINVFKRKDTNSNVELINNLHYVSQKFYKFHLNMMMRNIGVEFGKYLSYANTQV